MNRLVFVLAVLCAMAVVGGLFFFMSRPTVSAPVASMDGARAGAAEEPASSAPSPAPEVAREARVEPSPETPPAPPAVPELGTLRIDSDVAGAQVFIDRQFIGEAPVTARNVTPGTHRLNIDAPGFDGVLQTIDVEPGERELFVPLREVRLDTEIAVEHKHRIGSCRGQLVATPAGLRYEPTDGDDRFSVALTDLETFEVDYLEKNLRVRAGGRQYNFTDPDGNADALFVFHREVEQARDRLLSVR